MLGKMDRRLVIYQLSKTYKAICKSGIRSISCSGSRSQGTNGDLELRGRGVVIGCYENDNGIDLSERGKQLDERCGGKVSHLLKLTGDKLKKGESRLFYDLSEEFSHTAVVSVSKKNETENQEDLEIGKHNIRCAAAVGVKMLKGACVKDIFVEDFSDAEASAEGSHLSLFTYDDMKGKEKRDKIQKPSLQLFCDSADNRQCWARGASLAEAQNYARWLMDTPSNHMTPTMFVDSVSQRLGAMEMQQKSKVTINPRPLSWMKEKAMGAFLAVAKGSEEVPWLLEIHYNGGPSDMKPLALVGKGVTFDSGGISIKPSAGMGQMKGDMGGAACVAATTVAAATLGLPINIVSLMPLCENMPSGVAVKPGDVVTAMNGKTIEVDNTDAEGRLILADTLCYAKSFEPSSIVDLATLTGAAVVALGGGAAATYTTSSQLWNKLHMASRTAGDRLWRMPLYEQYTKQISSIVADVHNTGKGRSAGSCTAAAFLKEFVETSEWAHLDIAGVMDDQGNMPYLNKGMTGRPVRTMIEFIRLLSVLEE